MSKRLAIVSFAFVVAACGGSDKPESVSPATLGPDPGAARAPSTAAGDDRSCPVAVPGTSAAVEDAEGGAALVFATTGDAADVQRRAQEMARMHNEGHAKMGPLPTGGSGGQPSGPDHAAMGHGPAGQPAQPPQGGQGHAGHGGGEHAGHAGGMIRTHSHAAVQETPSGARIVFHADPSQVTALRDELQQHAQHLASGRCTM